MITGQSFVDSKRYIRFACDGFFAGFRDGKKEVVTYLLEMFFPELSQFPADSRLQQRSIGVQDYRKPSIN